MTELFSVPAPEGSEDTGVTTSMSVEVSLRDLRAALAAVAPHAEPTKTGDDVSVLARVRWVFDADELHLIATSDTAGTAVQASVDLATDTDTRRERFAPADGPLIVDTSPEVLRKVLQLHKVARATVDGADARAKLHVGDDGYIRVVDVSGLVPGASLRQPVLPLHVDYPDVRAAITRALQQAAGASTPHRALVAPGKPWRLFAHASAAYGVALRVQQTGPKDGRGWLVTCGPGFVGTFRSDDGDTLGRKSLEWTRHLIRAGLAEADPVLDLTGADETAGV